jgi:hypothetical protein
VWGYESLGLGGMGVQVQVQVLMGEVLVLWQVSSVLSVMGRTHEKGQLRRADSRSDTNPSFPVFTRLCGLEN